VRNADYKSKNGLAKSERIEDFGADRVLGHVGLATDVGDEGNSHGGLFSDASHRERSEPGEISTLVSSVIDGSRRSLIRRSKESRAQNKPSFD
jgi:hypothetical protein